MARRLPIYIVADRSGSMTGDPIEAVKQGIRTLVDNLISEPHTNETACLSVISFGSEARQDVPLQELMTFQPPDLAAGGQTALGAALRMLGDCIQREVKRGDKQKEIIGDWRPLVFLLTDGAPNDNWQEGLNALRQTKPSPRIVAVACGAGASDENINLLRQFAHNVIVMRNMDANGFRACFEMITQTSIAVASSGNPDGLQGQFVVGGTPAAPVAAPAAPVVAPPPSIPIAPPPPAAPPGNDPNTGGIVITL